MAFNSSKLNTLIKEQTADALNKVLKNINNTAFDYTITTSEGIKPLINQKFNITGYSFTQPEMRPEIGILKVYGYFIKKNPTRDLEMTDLYLIYEKKPLIRPANALPWSQSGLSTLPKQPTSPTSPSSTKSWNSYTRWNNSGLSTLGQDQSQATSQPTQPAQPTQPTQNGGKINILGRLRNVVQKGRSKLITYKNKLITITEARKIEKSLKKK